MGHKYTHFGFFMGFSVPVGTHLRAPQRGNLGREQIWVKISIWWNFLFFNLKTIFDITNNYFFSNPIKVS